MEINIDQIIRTRRKSIALIVQLDGKVVVRAPLNISKTRILQFVNSKADWILAQQKKVHQHHSPYHEYRDGESFPYLGKDYPLKLLDHQKQSLSLNSHFCLQTIDQPDAEKIFMQWYQRQARQVFTSRVEFFAKKHAFTYNKLKLSSARTRWGSCSSTGTLSFTWRLVKAPLEIIDYVVLHELVHLKIHNHSKVFWAKVQEYLPDYKKRRTWLKEHGSQLG
jgi:predicted metal-dependent hydrolase